MESESTINQREAEKLEAALRKSHSIQGKDWKAVQKDLAIKVELWQKDQKKTESA